MKTMEKTHLTDQELDRLLAAAQTPQLPSGFADRLQAKLQVERASNVVTFPQKVLAPQQQRRRIWLSAIPLAASLAVGIYLGAVGTLPESLAGLEGTLISEAADNLLGVGIEDTESFLNGDLS
jgi:hypothetical protein